MKGAKIEQISFVSDKLLDACYKLSATAAANVAEAEEVKSNLQKDVNISGHWLFTYTAQGQLRGFMKGHLENLPKYVNDLPTGQGCEMEWLYVDKRFQRQGIGTSLIKAYEKYAMSQGVVNLFGYLSNTKPLKKYFKKFGYGIIGWNNLIGKNLKTK